MYAWGRGDNGQLGIGKAWLLSITETGRLGMCVAVVHASDLHPNLTCGFSFAVAIHAASSLQKGARLSFRWTVVHSTLPP